MRHHCIRLAFVAAVFLAAATAQQPAPGNAEPLIIQEQGSFAAGGTIVTKPGTFNPKQPAAEGQTLHGDHAYVFYQVPANPRKLPLVFLHGAGQFSKIWETTPDGREGFQTIFLRRRFPVNLIDQPRRGNAGRREGGERPTARGGRGRLPVLQGHSLRGASRGWPAMAAPSTGITVGRYSPGGAVRSQLHAGKF